MVSKLVKLLTIERECQQHVWDELICLMTKSASQVPPIRLGVAGPAQSAQRQSPPEHPLCMAAPPRRPPSAGDQLPCLTANAHHRGNGNERLESGQGGRKHADDSAGGAQDRVHSGPMGLYHRVAMHDGSRATSAPGVGVRSILRRVVTGESSETGPEVATPADCQASLTRRSPPFEAVSVG